MGGVLCWLCIASSERLYSVERRVVYSRYCIAPNPQWRFPVWESCVDKLVKILLCEGEDVELGARTSKQISVFAFDPLTLNSLSITLCLASFHIDHSYIIC